MLSTATMPVAVKTFLTKIFRADFYPVFVGGIVRDYLLTKTWGNDFDIELRSSKIKADQWELALTEFYRSLASEYKIETFDFHICKLTIDGYSIELSSPRVENYQANNFTHKNFSATFSPELDFKTAFKRRDFTLNAIGIRLDEQGKGELVDPFNGAKDLKAGVLQLCSEDFFKDPVRFLRLIRFKTKFNFTIAPTILSNLGEFHLEHLSIFYFLKEWLKSDNYNQFLADFLQFKTQAKLAVNDKLKAFENLKNLTIDPRFFGKLKTSHQLYLLILIEKIGDKSVEGVAELFAVKQKDRVKYQELATALASKKYLEDPQKYQKSLPNLFANEQNQEFLALLTAKFASL